MVKLHEVRIIQKSVGQKPKEMIIVNNLKNYQKVVNGVIDIMHFNEISDDEELQNLMLVYNREKIRLGLKDNIFCKNKSTIKGDIFVIGDLDGDFVSVTKRQIQKILKILEEKEWKN